MWTKLIDIVETRWNENVTPKLRIVPNSSEAAKWNLDRYSVSIDKLERITGETIPVADYAKHDKPASY